QAMRTPPSASYWESPLAPLRLARLVSAPLEASSVVEVQSTSVSARGVPMEDCPSSSNDVEHILRWFSVVEFTGAQKKSLVSSHESWQPTDYNFGANVQAR